MSIGTYAELQSAIQKWMLRTSTDLVVTTAQIKNYIFLAEAELNRELRVRELEDSDDIPTVAEQNYVDLPATFKKIKDFYHTSSPYDLSPLGTKAELTRKWGVSTGRPLEYAIWGTKAYLGKIPDAIYTLTMDFYKAIPALADDNTTNVILTAYPDLYLYGALRQGYMNIKDSKGKGEAEALYVAANQRIKDADNESKLAASTRMKTRARLM